MEREYTFHFLICIFKTPRLSTLKMGRNKYIKCPTCAKNVRSDRIKTHTHEKYTKKRFTLCDKLFSSKRTLKLHTDKFHQETILSELITETPENIEKLLKLKKKLFK